MKKIFKGTVKNGRLELYEQEQFDRFLWSLTNKQIEVTVSKQVKRRSNPQNRYYHGCVLAILSDYTGHTPDEMHDAMRIKFLRDQTDNIVLLKSTTKLTTADFEEYMSRIRVWASSELGCYIPTPNEVEL